MRILHWFAHLSGWASGHVVSDWVDGHCYIWHECSTCGKRQGIEHMRFCQEMDATDA